MIIKDILFKFRQDLRDISRYPSIQAGKDFSIDYSIYWKKRRPGGMKPGLSVWQKERAELIEKFVPEGSVVMDVGCGNGGVLAYLREKKNIRPIGVENDRESLILLREQSIETIEADLNNPESITLLPEVDVVLGFEILEHMPNPEAFIAAITPKTRSIMAFSFPNTGYYLHRLRLLFGRFPLQWVVHPGEHLRFWTLSDAKSWVSELKLPAKAIYTYQGVPFLNRIMPSLFGQGILIVLGNKK